ncbi:hypothetical protein [Streptomyces albidoflavus]|uniref:hypothetical protein n=1 Tax=Streptomyces albidoflavus TaxID=1886 RepID=UPI00101EEC77|nr:hypothetical protein [Streptomyces albidoflavus]RZE73276.1 hypothetical protein C0R02_27450 [Streptomyces albidoflavus]
MNIRTRGRHRRPSLAQLEQASHKDAATIAAQADLIADLRTQLGAALREAATAGERARVAAGELAQLEQAVETQAERIADLERRLAVGVRAEHVIADTQPCPTVDGRFEDGPVRRLGASPLADTVEIPRPTPAA